MRRARHCAHSTWGQGLSTGCACGRCAGAYRCLCQHGVRARAAFAGDAGDLLAQRAVAGRAFGKQFARQGGGLGRAPGPGGQAHAGQLFTLLAVDLVEPLQLMRGRVLGLAGLQGVQNLARCIELVVAQRQVRHKNQALGRVGLHGQQLGQHLAGHVAAALVAPALRALQQLDAQCRRCPGVGRRCRRSGGCSSCSNSRSPQGQAAGQAHRAGGGAQTVHPHGALQRGSRRPSAA